MNKDSFTFKREWRDAICELPEEDKAALYVSIIEYGFTGEAPQLESAAERVAFAFVKAEIDRDNACEEHRAAVSGEMKRRVRRRWSKDGVHTGVHTEEKHVDTDVHTGVHTEEKHVYTGVDTEEKHVHTGVHTEEKHVDTGVDTDVHTGVHTEEKHVYTGVDTEEKHVYTGVHTGEKPSSPRACAIEDNLDDNISTCDNIINKEEKEAKGKKKTKGNHVARSPAKGTLSETIDARRRDFYNALVPFVDRYGKEVIRAFFNYWAEYNAPRTKMRWELQKTWETSRRLATWAARNGDFKSRTNGSRDYQREDAQRRADDAAGIMQELDAENEAV